MDGDAPRPQARPRRTSARRDSARASGQADQIGSQFGIIGSLRPAAAVAGPGEADAALQAWKRLNLGDRSIVLLDVSAAESLPLAPGAATRLQVLSQAASLGLSLFPDSTEMGIWEYPAHINGALPYRETVPLGPLPEQLGLLTRRQQLEQIANTIRPKAGPPPPCTCRSWPPSMT